MKKLLLLSVMLSLSCTVFAQTEPFCQSYVVFGADVNAVAVPENKEFVLLKLYVDCIDGLWQININNKMWLIGQHKGSYQIAGSSREFPEGSAVVGRGKNIVLKKSTENQYMYYTIVGYFRNTNEPVCLKYPDSDINKDCKVDMFDLALLASEWLECNLEPSRFCLG